jgi:DNA-binding SARP family transcriptional activator
MTKFRFQLLGPVRAWRDEAELEVGPPQQQAVLAVLLLSRGGHVGMATMLDALWGERPPKSGAGAVRTYVSRLRQILGAGDPASDIAIEPIGDGYALRGEHIWVDVEVFEERIGAASAAGRQSAQAAELCRAALRQWSGVPLVGVPGPYFEPVRTRMTEMRADAAEIEAAALVGSGDHLAAIANLRALITSYPLRESLHELLMVALYRAGRQADALEVYESARRVLRDELGIEPGPSLRRMQQRVLSADDDLVPAPVLDARSERGDRPWAAAAQERRGALRILAEATVDSAPAADCAGRVDRLEALSRQLVKSGGTDSRTVTARDRQGNGRTALAMRGPAAGGTSGATSAGRHGGVPRRPADSGSGSGSGSPAVAGRWLSGLIPAQRNGSRESSPLARRLQAARQRAFVGREREVEAFRSALDDHARPFTLQFVTGPGGIGKTSLLRRFAHEAHEAGRMVVELDGRTGECTAAAFEHDARPLPTAEPAVLIVDGFEEYQGLESWLREDFLPRLPLGSIVVFAGRVRPAQDWHTDPAWHEILRVVELGGLSSREAANLLGAREVPAPRREAVLAFASGNPLALTLAGDAAKRDAGEAADWAPSQEVIGSLVPQLVGEVPSPEYRRALDVCALLPTTNEELLRAVLRDPDADTGAIFAWLRSLPFIESGPQGVHPQDVVREILGADLRWRDPERHQLLRSRIPASEGADRSAAESDRAVRSAPRSQLSRDEFNAGVRAALRAWHRPDRLAAGPLAHTHLVQINDNVVVTEQIRLAIIEALRKLREDRYGERQYAAVRATYLDSESKQQQAVADELGLPFGTYRRHLTQGLDRLCELLWHRDPVGADARLSPSASTTATAGSVRD